MCIDRKKYVKFVYTVKSATYRQLKKNNGTVKLPTHRTQQAYLLSLKIKESLI